MSHQFVIKGFPEPTKKQPKKPQKLTFNQIIEAERLRVIEHEAFIRHKIETEGYPEPTIPFDVLCPQSVSFRPGYYTIYNDTRELRRRAMIKAQQVERKLNTGTLSRGAASKFRLAMDYLALISYEKNFYVTPYYDKNGKKKGGYHDISIQGFITLTLSDKQKHSDNFIKNNMLKAFIDACRKRWPGWSYVWRAEPQKLGNIHFHLVTDHFIPKTYANFIWNEIQKHYGYLDKYYKKKGHWRPPSVKIEKVRSVKDIQIYMRKYMTKNIAPREKHLIRADIDSKKNQLAFATNFWYRQRLTKELNKLEAEWDQTKVRKIEGKLWGCSDNLLLKPISFITDEMGMKLREQLITGKKLPEVQGKEKNPYFDCFEMNDYFNWIDDLPDCIREKFVNHLTGKNGIFKEKIPPVQVYCTTQSYSYN